MGGLEAELKGYNILSALDFAEARYGPAELEEIKRSLSPDFQAALPRLGRFDFVPRAYLGEITRAIARRHVDEDERVRVVAELGQSIAEGATNTFLRLMMRLMTPQIFAKKMPTIWAKDNRGGVIEVDSSRLADKELTVTFRDIAGFAYFNAMCRGWLGFAFTRMGAQDVSIEFPNASVLTEDMEETTMVIRWS